MTAVCFHGSVSCPFCGTGTVAPWRKGVGRFLARTACPCCGRRARKAGTCQRCVAAGYVALTLFDAA